MFSPVRYAGMALILGGLAVVVMPAGRAARPESRRAAVTGRHEGECDVS
jgi:hypothetical protein